METTARLALPLLVPGQAQKEVFHNEALQRLDGCVAACVDGVAGAIPPAAPDVGSCYLVAAGATGVWSGHSLSLAISTDGGWRFVAAVEGMRVFVASTGVDAVFRGGAWEYGVVRGAKLIVGGTQVVGTQQAAISAPTGGGVVDSEARATLAQLLAALRTHGLIAS